LTEIERNRFTELFVSAHECLCALARKSMGTAMRGKFDENDIVQDAAIKLVHHIERSWRRVLADQNQFLALGARVVRSVLHDARRRYTSARRDIQREVCCSNNCDSILVSTVSPGQSCAGKEWTAKVRGAVNRLDPLDRQVVLGRIVGDRSFSDIGKEVSLSISTVRKRFLRAWVRISDELLATQELRAASAHQRALERKRDPVLPKGAI
jgi:RNA polymerase sigma factor (sigma-70 family)